MRGYLSSVSPVLHFGLGNQSTVDSLSVDWPDGSTLLLTDITVNQRIDARQEDAVSAPHANAEPVTAFEAVPAPIRFTHQMAGDIDDFHRQPLMDHPQSFSGPPLARADVNGDGLEDLFAGGGNGQAGELFMQIAGGAFAPSPQPAFAKHAASHDTDALFFDANGDGAEDLYVASGGYGIFTAEEVLLQDRLYLNAGNGSFTHSPDALPEMLTSTGSVAPHDIDGNGSIDLFIGGRVVPGRYPEVPQSYILLNDGQGRFEDRTDTVGPALRRVGMVSDATWHDLNSDGTAELILAGLWMPLTIFEYVDGQLVDRSSSYFDKEYAGLWQSLLVDDLNGDGFADLVVGNLGLNTPLKADELQPATLFYNDFNNDGSMDPLLTSYVSGARYPYATLEELYSQMPGVATRFPNYSVYAGAKIEDLIHVEILEEAPKHEVRHLKTSLFMGSERGNLEPIELPPEVQFSPVFTITVLDYNEDGRKDLLLTGNTDEGSIRFGKYDAGYGVLLSGRGEKSFEYVPQYSSGLRLSGAIRSALKIDNIMYFGTNRHAIQAYRIIPMNSSQVH